MPNLRDQPNDEPRKYLILHADDLGVAHAVNVACFDAFAAGAISSASIMVPCPWFAEAVDFARQHPHLDLGIHLTITSEWPGCRWGSIVKGEAVGGLLDSLGYFRFQPDQVHAQPEEVEVEIRAQLSRAFQAGITPTHVDTHMFALLHPAYAAAYTKVARDFQLPFLAPASGVGIAHLFPKDKQFQAQAIVRVNVLIASPEVNPNEWFEYYMELLNKVTLGLNVLLVHPGYDTDELRAIAGTHGAWGSIWRQRDFDLLMSSEFKSACKRMDIEITTWRRIQILARDWPHLLLQCYRSPLTAQTERHQ